MQDRQAPVNVTSVAGQLQGAYCSWAEANLYQMLKENSELESDYGWNFTYPSIFFQKLSYCNFKAEVFTQI